MVARQWRRRSRALVAGGIIIEETYQLVLGKKRFFAGPPRAQDATQAELKTQVQNRYLGHPAEKSNPGPRHWSYKFLVLGEEEPKNSVRSAAVPQEKPKTQVQNRYLGHPAEKSNPGPRHWSYTFLVLGEEEPKNSVRSAAVPQEKPKTQVQNRYWGTRRRRATQDPGAKPVPGAPGGEEQPKTQVQNRYLGHPAEKSNPRPRHTLRAWGTLCGGLGRMR